MIVFLKNFGNLKFFINATINFIFESVQLIVVLQKFRPNQVLYTYLLIGVVTSFIHIKHFRIQGVRTKSRRREEGAIFPSLSACLLEQVRKYLEFLDLVYNNKRVLFQFCSQQVLPPIQNSSWFFRKWRVFACAAGGLFHYSVNVSASCRLQAYILYLVLRPKNVYCVRELWSLLPKWIEVESTRLLSLLDWSKFSVGPSSAH